MIHYVYRGLNKLKPFEQVKTSQGKGVQTLHEPYGLADRDYPTNYSRCFCWGGRANVLLLLHVPQVQAAQIQAVIWAGWPPCQA